MSSQSRPLEPGTIVAGIDWADAEHVVCLLDPEGRSRIESLRQSPEAIDEWAAELQRRFPGRTIAVAVEQTRGALMHALMKYDFFRLYPVNPKQLARYRESLSPAGGKGDPGDAALLAQFLRHYAEKLRPWKPDDVATRRLARLVELRRKLVEERKRTSQQLLSALKQYFPQATSFWPRHLERTAALVKRWPSLARLRRAHPKTLRAFLREHHIINTETQTEFIEAVRGATPLTKDPAIVEPNALYAESLAERIAQLNGAVDDFDERIAELVAEHDDAPLFRSFSGAGDALVPRLIVAFGSDRERHETADSVQCQSGTAPVTRQSGKTRRVSRRYACPKFLKQTFHEFADHARKWSRWAKAFYKMKRAAGFRHHAAVRALAYKLIRILFRCWKTRTLYDEDHHIAQLRRRNSPVLQFLETA